jgi:hypothetical protein
MPRDTHSTETNRDPMHSLPEEENDTRLYNDKVSGMLHRRPVIETPRPGITFHTMNAVPNGFRWSHFFTSGFKEDYWYAGFLSTSPPFQEPEIIAAKRTIV